MKEIIEFAINAHANTNHQYAGRPYSYHLKTVVSKAQSYLLLIPDEHRETVISACWLHDTIEDCRLTYNDVKAVAGEQVADIVYALTNEKGRSRKERANAAYYAGIRSTPFAGFVKLCDRLANVQYSFVYHSRMLRVYRDEHEDFLKNIFYHGEGKKYHEIIDEIESYFE